MRRVLIIIFISCLAGALLAKFLPAWQGDYLKPGDQRAVGTAQDWYQFTWSGAEGGDRQFALNEDDARAVQGDLSMQASAGLRLTADTPEVRAGEVHWTERHNKRTQHYSAPGLFIGVSGEVQAEPAAVAQSAEVWLQSATLQDLARRGKLVVRHGSARVEPDGQVLLRRFQMFRSAAERESAVLGAAVQAGAPFALALAALLLWLFGFPKVEAKPVEPSGLPVTFGRKLRGARTMFALAGVLVCVILGAIFGTTTTLRASHLDIGSEITTGLVVAIAGGLYLAVIGYCAMRLPREVTLTHDGVEVRGGVARKLRLQANWRDLAGVEHTEQRRKGQVVDETVDFIRLNGKKERVSRQHVVDFAILSEAARRLFRQSKAAASEA